MVGHHGADRGRGDWLSDGAEQARRADEATIQLAQLDVLEVACRTHGTVAILRTSQRAEALQRCFVHNVMHHPEVTEGR